MKNYDVDVVFTTYKRPIWSAMTALGFVSQTQKPKRIVVSIEYGDTETPKMMAKVEPILNYHGIDLEITSKEGISGLVDCKNLALRAALAHSDSSWVFLIDDDLWFDQYYIETLADSLVCAEEEGARIGGISGTILNLGAPAPSHSEPTTRLTKAPNRLLLQTLEAEVHNWRDNDGSDKVDELNKYQIHNWADLPERESLYKLEYYVCSYWLSKDVIKETGEFNIKLNTSEAVWEEVEYTNRVFKLGYDLILDPSVSGYHITVGEGGIYKEGLTHEEYAERSKAQIKNVMGDMI